MENETFRSRVANLVARSRKALRLYSHAPAVYGSSAYGSSAYGNRNNSKADNSNAFNDAQTSQWKDITADLLKDLSTAVQKNQSVKNLSATIFSIRDKFNSTWRAVESEMHLKHKELVAAAESGDFIKAATIGTNLVSLKARFQASQAAHHELEELIKSCHYAHDPIELTNPMALESREGESRGGEIIETESSAEKSVANSKRNYSVNSSSKPAKVIPIRKVL